MQRTEPGGSRGELDPMFGELASIPANPPRTGFLPGMRFSSAIPRSTLILLLAFVLLFAVFPLSIMSTDPKAKLGIGPSGTAEGRVLSVTDVSACRGSAARRIVYAFSAESSSEFRGVGVVCEESAYYSTRVGEKIEIRFLKRDPAVNAIAGTEAVNEPPLFLFMIFPLFFLLILSPLYLPQLREVVRARRLYKKGALVEGKVVFVKRRSAITWPGWPGSTTADVYVAHQTPSGGRVETVVGCSNDWLLNQLSPGATVHILLAQDKSARGALVEAFIR
jgi:hypothetical protein